MKSVVCEGEFCHCDYAHFCNCNELCAREERVGGLVTRQRAEQIGRNIGKYGCVITEQRHLPECPWDGDCICNALRSCEERVRREEWMASDIYAMGRDDALEAAHDAVAAIRGRWVFGPRIYKHDALTAIDVLQKEHK